LFFFSFFFLLLLQYNLQPSADGIYRLVWIQFIDGSNLRENFPFTQCVVHLAQLLRNARKRHNNVRYWLLTTKENDTLTEDMIGYTEGEWAELLNCVHDWQGKKIHFEVYHNADKKMASALLGLTGPAGCRPLTSTNVHKKSFLDLKFEVGQDNTYWMDFEKHMTNFLAVEAFKTFLSQLD